MKNIKKYVLFIVYIGLLILLMDVNAYSYIKSNGAGRGYEGSGDSVESINVSIEPLIIQGAGYYFAASSNIATLLKLVELRDVQGLDFNVLNNEIDNAIGNMKNAIQTYENLVKEAEVTPYNETVQTKLKNFKYEAYMISNGLNKDVFDEVKNFLSIGDITGSLKKTHKDFKIIFELLLTIKSESSLTRVADLSIFWRLKEKCSESDLFGGYVSRIFSAIL
ncbi:MAG: hypothetical protein NT166_06430 [Candidatus Aminicenantes bacterium]|nr:hypothetical protein [Candidatus Aminicenantes bacterium]